MTDSEKGAQMAPTGSAFREAMSFAASSVHLVTSVGEHGDAGITATAVCPISDSPPSLLVCLNRRSYAYRVIIHSRVLAVHNLRYDQRALADVFAGRGSWSMPERFAAARWTRGSTGTLLLEDCLASFDCRVERSLTMGTHELFLCVCVDIVRATPRVGLGYVARRYFSVDLDHVTAGPSVGGNHRSGSAAGPERPAGSAPDAGAGAGARARKAAS